MATYAELNALEVVRIFTSGSAPAALAPPASIIDVTSLEAYVGWYYNPATLLFQNTNPVTVTISAGSSGRLAAMTPAASVAKQTIYTCPQGKVATFTINIVNYASGAVSFNLYLTTAPTAPSASELLENAIPVVAGETYERTGIMLGAGQSLVLVGVSYTYLSSCSVMVWGTEV